MDSAGVSFIIPTSSVRGRGAVSTSCQASSVVSRGKGRHISKNGLIFFEDECLRQDGMNHSLKIIFLFSGGLRSLCSSWVLWSRTRVQILKGNSEHFFLPTVHANGCLMSLASYPQGEATVSISASKTNLYFKEFKYNFNSLNLS